MQIVKSIKFLHLYVYMQISGGNQLTSK